MKGFDQILHELEAGKISAQQAKDLTLELLEDARIKTVFNGSDRSVYETGVDCCMIRLGLKEWEETI